MSSVVILNFPMRHAHDRYVCLILFKFGYDVAICNPLFGNENQENRSITSGFIKNRTYDFFFFLRFSPRIDSKIKFVRQKQARCRFRIIKTC